MFNFESIQYYLIFLLSLVFFIVSLIMYCKAKKQNKKKPGTYNEMQIQSRKNLLIAASTIFSLFAIIIIGYVVLLMMVLAHM